MDTCAIVLHLVVHGYYNSVSPVGLYPWTWELSVDEQGLAHTTVWGNCGVGDIQGISNYPASLWSKLVIVGQHIRTTIWK